MGWILLGSPLSLSLSSCPPKSLSGLTSFLKPLIPQRTWVETNTKLHHKGREARLSKPQSQVECRIKSNLELTCCQAAKGNAMWKSHGLGML